MEAPVENQPAGLTGQRTALRQRAGAMLLALADVYTIPALIYVVLRAASGYALWPVAFASNLLPWLAVPGLVLVPVLSIFRRWYRAALNVPIAAALLLLYGGLFLPKPVTPPCAPPCQTLRVMHLNAAGDLPDSNRLIKALGESQADIITLVEVSDEQGLALNTGLADIYPYRVLERTHEAGLLSRYPIKHYQFLSLAGRSFLQAELEVDGRPLRVLVVHTLVASLAFSPPGYIAPSHDSIVKLAQIAAKGLPTLMAGDFNMTDQSGDYDLLVQAGLRDSFREAGFGWGATYPLRRASDESTAMLPFLRIDYLWHTTPFQAIEARLGPDAGSDHLPILVELEW